MVRTVLVDASRKVQEAHNDQIASGSVEVLDSPSRERLADLGRLWSRTVNLDHLQILLFKKLRQGLGVLVHGCQIDNP